MVGVMMPDFPQMSDLFPDWEDVLKQLQTAEEEVARMPKGTPERRAASKKASKLARQWRRMKSDLYQARIDAGWFPASALSWAKLLREHDEPSGTSTSQEG